MSIIIERWDWISKVLSNPHAISKEKDPKEPKGGNFLEICRKDFRDFKEKKGEPIIEFLSNLIMEQERKGKEPGIIIQQKFNLENVRKLIKEGNERNAFSLFYRTFPYCMPYRSL